MYTSYKAIIVQNMNLLLFRLVIYGMSIDDKERSDLPYYIGVKGQGQLYLNSVLQLLTRTLLSFIWRVQGVPENLTHMKS